MHSTFQVELVQNNHDGVHPPVVSETAPLLTIKRGGLYEQCQGLAYSGGFLVKAYQVVQIVGISWPASPGQLSRDSSAHTQKRLLARFQKIGQTHLRYAPCKEDEAQEYKDELSRCLSLVLSCLVNSPVPSILSGFFS